MAIIGAVGSGKSTLLSAILGDTYKFHGELKVEVHILLIFIPSTCLYIIIIYNLYAYEVVLIYISCCR